MPTTISLQVVYVDDYLVVLNKPPHLLTVPGKYADATDCLSYLAQQVYSDALIVHRLDMATSGLLLMARGKEVQGQLSRLFRERQIRKLYTAVCHGVMNFDAISELPEHTKQLERLTDERLLVSYPMIADWPNRPLQKIDFEVGKNSQTIIKVIGINKELQQTRVELEPLTGRSHQLRLHLKTLGHSIVGDSLYPPDDQKPSTSVPQANDPRLLLHAHFLCFIHPVTQEIVNLQCHADF